MTPGLSVVIPYWHGERTIARALRSVMAERGVVDITPVVVDDGSAPASSAALALAAAEVPRCRILRLPHGGTASARTAGVMVTDTELVAFCDQDDEWLPGRLAAQLSLLDADPTMDFVTGAVEMRVEDGYRRPAWCREEWLAQTQPGNVLGAMVVRRSAFERTGTFDPDLVHGCDDVDWLARCRRMGLRSAPVDRVVLRRWVHDANASSDRGNTRELLAVVRRHARQAAES